MYCSTTPAPSAQGYPRRRPDRTRTYDDSGFDCSSRSLSYEPQLADAAHESGRVSEMIAAVPRKRGRTGPEPTSAESGRSTRECPSSNWAVGPLAPELELLGWYNHHFSMGLYPSSAASADEFGPNSVRRGCDRKLSKRDKIVNQILLSAAPRILDILERELGAVQARGLDEDPALDERREGYARQYTDGFENAEFRRR